MPRPQLGREEPDEPGVSPRWSGDVVASSAGACLFSVSLGISTVALPLVALESGQPAWVIGLLVSMSAAVQSLTRTTLGAAMRRFADKDLLVLAGVAQAVSGVIAAVAPVEPVLAGAWALQGVGRACFWTGSQTHVVRRDRSPIESLALLNLMASIGQFTGPALAGALAHASMALALIASAAVSVSAAGTALRLDRLPTFPPLQRTDGGFWSNQARAPSTSAALTAGAWRGLLDSFVPVVLRTGGQSVGTIGALISVANGAAVVGSVLIARLPAHRAGSILSGATLMTGLGLAVLSYSGERVWLAATMLGTAGLGAGVLQTLGPSLAALDSDPGKQGDAIATYGTVRSTAAFGSPLTASALSFLVPVDLALAFLAVLITAPMARHRRT
jgi:hypothetical protein